MASASPAATAVGIHSSVIRNLCRGRREGGSDVRDAEAGTARPSKQARWVRGRMEGANIAKGAAPARFFLLSSAGLLPPSFV